MPVETLAPDGEEQITFPGGAGVDADALHGPVRAGRPPQPVHVTPNFFEREGLHARALRCMISPATSVSSKWIRSVPITW